MPYGVEPQRTGDPKVTTAPIDRQRLYMGRGGSLGMLGSAGRQPSVNRKRASKKRY